MSYDFYAEFRATKPHDLRRIIQTPGLDLATRISLLALTNATEGLKEIGRAEYRDLIHVRGQQVSPYDGYCATQLETMGRLGLITPNPVCMDVLPEFSALIKFPFVLSKSYLSKDDEAFHIIDNPVRKDRVFQVPMVASTSWKGRLRWAATEQLADRGRAQTTDEVEKFALERLRLTRLFGDEKGEEPGNIQALARFLDEAGGKKAAALYRQMVRAYVRVSTNNPMPHYAGRLSFFPTFFNRMDLDVINPHVRERKVGTVPILMECVPKGARGEFALLYIPFDRSGAGEADPERSFKPLGQEVMEDMALITAALQAMFTIYGFGAKTSSGFGLAKATFPKAEDGGHGGLISLKGSKGRIYGFRVGTFAGLVGAVGELMKKLEVGHE